MNSKGVGNNKSLYTTVHTTLKLPRDKYLFPNLTAIVRDSFLGLFPWVSNDWGNFNIDLKKHLCREMINSIMKKEVN